MKTRRKKILLFSIATIGLILLGGISYASFMDKSSVLGSTFSVGSSDIKLLENVAGSIEETNLVDEITGPSFGSITPYWQQDYLLKIYNNATFDLDLTSNAEYETANDPEEVRQLVYVEPLEWEDNNANGLLDDGENVYSYGRKSIVKWKTEGFTLGTVAQGEIKGIILRFTTDTISDTKQGASGIFDFEFNAAQVQ